ncbi:hypothetical protein ACHAW6_011461 [Cyclotella cf. meneghiniana]
MILVTPIVVHAFLSLCVSCHYNDFSLVRKDILLAMGFAEQLAAKAAEAKSHREKIIIDGNTGSVGSGRTKVRRPRIRPIDEHDDADADSVRQVDHFGDGGQWNTARDSTTPSCTSFAEQLKHRATRTQIHSQDGSINTRRVDATFTQDSNRDSIRNESDTNVTDKQSNDHNGRHHALDSPPQSIINREDPSPMSSPHPVQMQQLHSNEQTSPSPTLSYGNTDTDQPQQLEAKHNTNQHNLRHLDTPLHHPQKQPPKHGPCDTPDTTAIFGAWAQIEQLQRRLKEAESRAQREMRRAELAEQRGHATDATPRNFGGADTNGEKTLPNDSNVKREVQIYAAEKRPSDKSSKIADTDKTKNQAFQERESAESFETVPLATDEGPPASTIPMQSYETPPKNNHTSNDTAYDQLLKWKKRALEAEDRLIKQDYSILVSPPSSSTGTRPPPPPQQLPSSAVESDLIQLKNAEIEVLRSQISRLELRIKEECQRNSDMLQAYQPHRDSPRPPVVVAEYTSSIAGESLHEYEFRILREEIRHLQYQLSQKKTNANTSAQSTTGSTLSSLENENEEEEDEQGDAGKASSSWGLCCVRRSKRGYGRVSR